MEIELRAWNEGEMIYPSTDGHGTLTSGWILSNYTNVMLWTGLLDVNGKEIYHSDKVKCLRPDGTDTGNEDVIEFKNGCFYLRHRNINVEAWTHYEARDGESWNGQFEVIGNIYERNLE